MHPKSTKRLLFFLFAVYTSSFLSSSFIARNRPMNSMYGHGNPSSTPLGANPYGPPPSASSSLGGLNMAAYGARAALPPPPVNFSAAPAPPQPAGAAAGAPVLRRAGRWTIEEETYARAIIAHFQTGKIDLEVRIVCVFRFFCGGVFFVFQMKTALQDKLRCQVKRECVANRMISSDS